MFLHSAGWGPLLLSARRKCFHRFVERTGRCKQTCIQLRSTYLLCRTCTFVRLILTLKSCRSPSLVSFNSHSCVSVCMCVRFCAWGFWLTKGHRIFSWKLPYFLDFVWVILQPRIWIRRSLVAIWELDLLMRGMKFMFNYFTNVYHYRYNLLALFFSLRGSPLLLFWPYFVRIPCTLKF